MMSTSLTREEVRTAAGADGASPSAADTQLCTCRTCRSCGTCHARQQQARAFSCASGGSTPVRRGFPSRPADAPGAGELSMHRFRCRPVRQHPRMGP